MDTFKRQWIGIALGMLALFVALNGPAVASDTAKAAGKLITSKQIKDGMFDARFSRSSRRSVADKSRELRSRCPQPGPDRPYWAPVPPGTPTNAGQTGVQAAGIRV